MAHNEKGARLRMRPGKFLALTVVPMALVLVVALLLTAAGTVFAPTLGALFGEGAQTVQNPDGVEEDAADYYEEKYGSAEEAKEAAYKTAARILQEGTVLLKNDGALPLAQGSEVTPYGYGALHPVYGQMSQGGSTKWDDDPVTPEEGLSSVYEVNRSALEAMEAAGDPEVLAEAEGATPAGDTASLLGGDSFIFEYDPSIYDGIDAGGTGVVFITRTGQEGQDKKFDAYSDGTPHYLALSENEKETIRAAKEQCDKVVVVLVASQTMEVAPLMDGEYEADAIVWMGNPGELGFSELGHIMDGEVNPSGRTVDIWATDFTADPSYANIGDFRYDNADFTMPGFMSGMESSIARPYLEYQEGVYMGYRYYETADVEDDAFTYGTLDGQGGIAEAGAVTYPFGYGLSYTSFTQQISSYDDSGETITMDVTVTNTGDVAGKDVVQVYYESPYTDYDRDHKVEKPVCVLADFAKTGLLEPGESQAVTLSFDKQDMASYDYTHDNGNGTTGCYLLEAGDYQVTLRANSHDVIDTRTTTIAETTFFDGSDADHIRTSDKEGQSELDPETGEAAIDPSADYVAATNKFQASSDYMNEESTILTRSDWKGTQPVRDEDRTKSLAQRYAEMAVLETEFDVENDRTYGNVEGSVAYHADPPASGEDNGLTLASMRGLSYDDPQWEKFLNQIDWSDRTAIEQNFAGDAYRLGGIDSLGMPQTKVEDGGNGLKVESISQSQYDMGKSASYPFHPTVASTWNVDLLYEMGAALGQEALANGINGWYSPGINLHRSPFSGRVFEYYSEDPLLSGKLAAAITSGAGDNGLFVTLKHFALNEMETNRSNYSMNWADEQTMRELYLRPFEIAVKDARMTETYLDEDGTRQTKVMRATTGIMPNQGGVGPVVGTVNADLLQGVLRGEWGFRGLCFTDYWVTSNNSFRDLALRTGSDAYLSMYLPMFWKMVDYESPSAQWAMRNAIHNIAYTMANSNAVQGAAPGATYRTAVPGWRIGLTVANIVVAGPWVLWLIRVIMRFRACKAHPETFKPRRRDK